MNTNTFLRNSIITGLFLSLFIPLIIFNSAFFPFITGKNIAFRLIVEIVFALYLLLALREPLYRPKKNWLTYAVGIFAGLILISDIFGANPVKSLMSNFERMEGFVTIAHFALYYLVLSSVFTTQKIWERFFQVSLSVSTILGVYGFLQLAKVIVINQGGVRLDGTFGNATYFAVFMLFNIFFALIVLSRAWKQLPEGESTKSTLTGIIYSVLGFTAFVELWFWLSKMLWTSSTPDLGFYFFVFMSLVFVSVIVFVVHKYPKLLVGYGVVALIISTVTLFHTATRGATLGLFGGLLLATILIALFERERPRIRKWATGSLIFLVIVGGSLFALRTSDLVKSSPALARITSITLKEGSSRFMVWGMALEGFKENPIFGWGQEGFNFVFNKYYNPGMWAQEQWFDRTHNIFFDWLIAGGLLGLLAYLSLFVFALHLLWRRNPGFFNFSVTEKALLTGLFAGYFFHNIFVFDNIMSYILFAILLAYISRTASEGRPVIGGEKAVSSETIGMVVAPTVIVLTLSVMWMSAVKPAIAAQALIDALRPQQGGPVQNLEAFKKVLDIGFAKPEIREQLMQAAITINGSNADLKIKKDFIDLARVEFEKQLIEVAGDARYELFYGVFLNRINMREEGLVHLNRALELSPKKQVIMFEIASAYLANNKVAEALPVLKRAYDLEPRYDEARRIYAVGALYAKNTALATELLKNDAPADIANDDRLLSAYVNLGDFAKVVEVWKLRVVANPQSEQAHLALAAAYLKVGNRTGAVEEIRNAITLNPSIKQQGEFYINEIKAGRNP